MSLIVLGRRLLPDDKSENLPMSNSRLSASGIRRQRKKRNGEVNSENYRELVCVWWRCLSLLFTIHSSLFTSIGYYGSALLIGLGNGHMWPAFQNMTINVAHNNQRGTANSTILISWDIGMGLGILVGGVVSELLGYSAAFWTVVLVNASGVACFFLATKAFFLRRNLNETVR